MRRQAATIALAATAALAAARAARADEPSPAGWPPAQMPYAVPRQTMIPGTPGMAGGIHLMLNAFGLLENQGLGAIAVNVGLHVFGMWMLDYSFRRMHHDH